MSQPVPGQRPAAPEPLRLVQEFLNTRWERAGVEELDSPRGLLRWAAARGLVETDAPVGQSDLDLALALRDTLRELLAARRPVETGVLASLPLRCDIQAGRLVLVPDGAGITAALARILIAGVEAERDGRWERLKLCAAPDCRWAFYDPSRNRSATWCNMAVCGSRAKARSYYRRQRAASALPTPELRSPRRPRPPEPCRARAAPRHSWLRPAADPRRPRRGSRNRGPRRPG
ncbi:CGNR zinc finger domain-containing protein [Stackebrandtia nassauensis]|uniref:CGNR zinc finger domain-containing protein n=1 Tax=Stackebrandtia nassauensis TaxID=283811 RepID=UPI0009FEA205|nr:CGNR zinc finger domain-containing protein [Stackebrandtia nassauensis]